MVEKKVVGSVAGMVGRLAEHWAGGMAVKMAAWLVVQKAVKMAARTVE
jgi:hypothetical protein